MQNSSLQHNLAATINDIPIEVEAGPGDVGQAWRCVELVSGASKSAALVVRRGTAQ